MKSLRRRRRQGACEENAWDVGFPACASSGICDMEVRFTSTYRPPQGIVHKNFLFVSMPMLSIILHMEREWAVDCDWTGVVVVLHFGLSLVSRNCLTPRHY